MTTIYYRHHFSNNQLSADSGMRSAFDAGTTWDPSGKGRWDMYYCR
jgi:hypothetical protein